MSFSTEPIGDPAVPASLEAPVSAASTPVQATPPTLTPISSPQVPQMPQPVQQQSAADEARIRHFQAEADRAKAEAAALKAQLDQVAGNQKAIVDGSAQAVQQMANQIRDLNERVARETAERLKAEALMQKPHLRDYASFIPATTDPAQLAQYVSTLEAARAADLEAVKAQALKDAQAAAAATAAAAPSPQSGSIPAAQALNPLGALYGQLPTPAMNPATPSASASNTGITTPEAMRAALEEAQQRASAELDPNKAAAIFQAEINRQAAIGQSYIQQQMSR